MDSGKENASLAGPHPTGTNKATTAPKGRKRAITLMNGAEIDLSSEVPVTKEVVEALKARIIELEDELSAEAPPAKRARKSNATTTSAPAEASSSSGPGPSAASSKAEEKKRKVQLKKIYDRLKKECKSDAVKFQGSPKSIKIEEVLEKSEFDAIFLGKGTLIQPTPTNKPKSTVTIIQYNPQQVLDLFQGELKPLKGNRWTRGGVPTRTFGAGFGGFGSTFAKSVKQGAVDVTVQHLEANYSSNGMKCTLKFDVAEDYSNGSGRYDSDDDYY